MIQMGFDPGNHFHHQIEIADSVTSLFFVQSISNFTITKVFLRLLIIRRLTYI